MREVRVTSWSELTEACFQEAWNPTIERYRCHEAFRGLSDSAYELVTSLTRLGGAYERLERNLFRNFKKYAHREAAAGDSDWNWLAVAQHHGLPTRLMDWTFSPYAAVHFATSNLSRYDVDGVVWCVDYLQVHKELPEQLREILSEQGSNVFTVEMLGRGSPSLAAFQGVPEFAAFFEPPSLDARIVNQSALFSVMSTASASMSAWLETRPHLVRRVIIPADLKWEVRDKLDELNVTERVLFPGLDGLSDWLARYYGPKRPEQTQNHS